MVVMQMRPQSEPKDKIDLELGMMIRQDERELNRLNRENNRRAEALRERVIKAHQDESDEMATRVSSTLAFNLSCGGEHGI